MDSFPVKLHACLIELEHTGQSHVASFQPHGRALMVRKPDDFLAVLPRWFNMTKIESFQRQLNFYGFQRITKGPDKHAYYHPLFQRDHAALASDIPRLGNKGAGPRKAVECCPDFSVPSTGHKIHTAVANQHQGRHAELSEPNMAHTSMPQLMLNRLAPQQSVHSLTTAPPLQGVNLSSWTASTLAQHIQQPPFASLPAADLAHGASGSFADRVTDRLAMDNLSTDHRAEILSLAIDLNRQSRLQQQQELEQCLRDEQILHHTLAVAAPSLPRETTSLLHAALRQQQLERQYQESSFNTEAAREIALAQSVVLHTHSYDAMLPSLVSPAVRGFHPTTGLSSVARCKRHNEP